MIEYPEANQLYKTARVAKTDIEAIESAADALIRSRDTQTAINLYALALRLRSETGLHPLRRADDEQQS